MANSKPPRRTDDDEVTPTGDCEPTPVPAREPKRKAASSWLVWVPVAVIASGVVAQSAVTKVRAEEADSKATKTEERVRVLEVTVAKQSADLDYLKKGNDDLKKASDETNRKLDRLLEKK